MNKQKAKKIVEKIKTDKIVPDSKFLLNWKSYLFWIGWFLMLISGALFVSLTIFNFMDFHPGFLKYLGIKKIIRWLIFTAPFFWILLSLGALVFGLLAFRKTRRGYRYSLLFVTSLTVLIVSILGVIFHFSKISDHFQKGLFPNESGMRKMAFPIEERWQKPEEGFLAGEIKSLEKNRLELEDQRGEKWTVYFSSQTKILKKVDLENGNSVGIVGEKKGKDEFEAKAIGPFPERGMHPEGKVKGMKKTMKNDDRRLR